MGLVNCDACGNEVGSGAAVCPKCGKKQRKARKTRSPKKLFIIFFAVLVSIGAPIARYMSQAASGAGNRIVASENDRTTSDMRAAPAAKESEVSETDRDGLCKLNLQCWAKKNKLAADRYCESAIQKKSGVNARWTDGFLNTKFSQIAWLDRRAGTLSYIGDEIEFQSAVGESEPQIYRCDFDPSSQTVIQVYTIPGQLKD